MKLRMPVTAALCAITLVAAVPQDVQYLVAGDPHIPQMQCSTTYGCEVDLPPGETLKNVVISDPRFQGQLLSDGTDTPASYKVLPSLVDADANSAAPLRAQLDMLTNVREYHVVLVASSRLMPATIAYREPGRVVATVVSSTNQVGGSAEATAVDPKAMDFGWTSKGTNGLACVTVFDLAQRGQLWCKLPATVLAGPSVYIMQNGARESADARMIQGNYLVIDTLASPVSLEWPDGRTITISRSRE